MKREYSVELTTWFAYLGVITALIALPGPSSLLITLHGYQYGLKKSNHTIIGNMSGSFILMGLSALGLGLLLTTSETVFTLTKYIGASYLIYLGINSWRKSAVIDSNKASYNATFEKNSSLFKQGFLTGISNPKDLLFFTALFPAFLNDQQSLFMQLVILMTTWLVVDYMIKVIYVLMGKKINSKFSNPSFLKIFNRLTGGIFVGFGLLLASARSS